MSLSQDFYGAQKFVWWVGVVEDRFDPAKLGRVRVRIIGIDSFDTSLLPREKLPWAQMLSAVNGSKTQSPPKEGDWVFGFFQDGEAAQIRNIIGFFPGVESGDIYTSQTLSTQQKQQLDAQVEAQIANAEEGELTNADTPASNVAYADTTTSPTSNVAVSPTQNTMSTAQLVSTASATGDVVLVVGYRKEDYPSEYEQFLAAETKKYPNDPEKAAERASVALKESLRSGSVQPKGGTQITLGSSWGLDLNSPSRAYNLKYQPRVPRYAKVPKADEPTGSRLARGILANTGIEWMNERLAKVCPSDLEIRQRIGANKYVRQILIKLSRAIAKAINALLGADPSGRIAYWTKKIQQINTFIQDILDTIGKIQDFVKLVVTTVQLARLIVDWIRNLPERFKEMLKDCLKKILSIIKSYLVEFIQEELAANLGGTDNLTKVMNDFNALQAEVDELQDGITQLQEAGEFVAGLENLPDLLESIATTETTGDIGDIELTALQLGQQYDALFDISDELVYNASANSEPGI